MAMNVETPSPMMRCQIPCLPDRPHINPVSMNDHPAILAAFRRDSSPQSDGFLVICNFDTLSPQSISIDILSLFGDCSLVRGTELLTGAEINALNPRLEITLNPCDAQVIKLCVVHEDTIG